MIELEAALHAGDDEAGMRLGTVIADYSSLGGYELEGQWDACCRQIVGAPFSELADRPARTLSGGERKQLVLELLFGSDADVLLLDEPDNFLDVPAKLALERRIRRLAQDDPDDLARPRGAGGGGRLDRDARGQRRLGPRQLLRDLRPGPRGPPAAARRRRQALARGGAAAVSPDAHVQGARPLPRRVGQEGRRDGDPLEAFRDAGPPPAPVTDQQITVRIRGGDSARIVLRMRGLAIDGLVEPFDEEIHFGERVALIGPNGTGKSSLMNVLTGVRAPDAGTLVTGPRVQTGHFTQLQTRPDFAGRGVLEIVSERRGELQTAMAALARYRLADAARRQFEVLSGGEQARLEILILELEGANLLLLDEPTDNLDADSCEALEAALDGFTGTVVTVSHDRAFLRRCDRFLLLDRDGSMLALPTYEAALEALTDPAGAADVSLAKRL